jgi:hypothetical protein
LRKLSSGKAPGVDGLPIKIYKTFWPSIGDAYMDLLLECLESKELPSTMRTSVVTLIYEKEDRKKLKNYRPISLLCADYKIIAKVMAERMRKVMHKLVLDDRTGFVPGRNINQNIITFLEVQDYMHNAQKSGFAFLLILRRLLTRYVAIFSKLPYENSILETTLSLGFSLFTINPLQSLSSIVFGPTALIFFQESDRGALGLHHYLQLPLSLWPATFDSL